MNVFQEQLNGLQMVVLNCNLYAFVHIAENVPRMKTKKQLQNIWVGCLPRKKIKGSSEEITKRQ